MFSRVVMSGRLQGLFALLPVAGAQLVGLQRIEHAEHLLGAAADVEVGDVDEADDPLRIHDEGRALRHAGLGVEDADRKSTRLNSSHGYISYAVFCLKKT